MSEAVKETREIILQALKELGIKADWRVSATPWGYSEYIELKDAGVDLTIRVSDHPANTFARSNQVDMSEVRSVDEAKRKIKEHLKFAKNAKKKIEDIRKRRLKGAYDAALKLLEYVHASEPLSEKKYKEIKNMEPKKLINFMAEAFEASKYPKVSKARKEYQLAMRFKRISQTKSGKETVLKYMKKILKFFDPITVRG